MNSKKIGICLFSPQRYNLTILLNELTTGDKVTLRAVAVIFSPEKKPATTEVRQNDYALQITIGVSI